MRRFLDHFITIGRHNKLMQTAQSIGEDGTDRERALIEEFGLSEEIVAKLPPDVVDGIAPWLGENSLARSAGHENGYPGRDPFIQDFHFDSWMGLWISANPQFLNPPKRSFFWELSCHRQRIDPPYHAPEQPPREMGRVFLESFPMKPEALATKKEPAPNR